MTDKWDAFLDVLGPELAAAAIAAGSVAPPPPPEVGEMLRSVFATADIGGRVDDISTHAA